MVGSIVTFLLCMLCFDHNHHPIMVSCPFLFSISLFYFQFFFL